jgi:outer membrane cobalamin receptor
MKKLTMLLVALVASCAICAQTTPSTSHTVKGILLDSLTLEAEPYATIKIVRKDAPGKAVKMAVTGNNGKFEEKITGSGDYVLTITSIGKSTVVRAFNLAPSEKVKDFGTLYASDIANELQGVEIVAQKPLVKVDIDKIEYNVEDDPDSKTNSVLEMLRKVPLVTVDGEDKIQVNGSSSFKVHVNGKPNNMMSDNPTEVLKSMPANSIKNIEVITNPGAKYDAEGIGGILNIVTVGAGFEGYTATFSGNASNQGAGGGIYATVKQNKLTLTGRYNYNQNDRPRGYSDSERENGSSLLQTDGWSKNKGSFQQGTLEASYEVDTLRLITLSFGMYGGGNEGYGNTNTWFEDRVSSVANPLYSYQTLSSNESSWYSIRGNIDYQRSFSKKGRLLTFSYNINARPQGSDSYTTYEIETGTPPYPLLDSRSDGEQNTTEHTFQADYTTPIGKYHTVEGGVKYIIRDNISDNDRYVQEVVDSERSSHYKHLNDILAAYSSYALRYKTFSGKAGLRYERTMQDVKYPGKPEQNFKVDYNDVVPSASIGFKLGETQNIRTGYQMRIWRPGIFFLNPYRNDLDPTNVRQGNPNLETEKSHAFNLSYSSFTSKFNLNLSLSHSFNNNAIEQVVTLEEKGTTKEYLFTTYENIGKRRSVSLSGYVNWNASPKTRVYMNLNGTYIDLRNPARELRNSGWDAFVYGGVQHTLPWEFRLSLNLIGGAPPVTLQGKGDGFYDYNLALNRSFINKRLTISAFASNFLKKYRKQTSETLDVAFSMKSSNYYPAQRFGVSISYRIGELKASVKKAVRTITNDDEKGGGSNESSGDV